MKRGLAARRATGRLAGNAIPSLVRLFTLLVFTAPLSASVQLAGPFSDHMVLQARRPVPVWGTAAVGEKSPSSSLARRNPPRPASTVTGG